MKKVPSQSLKSKVLFVVSTIPRSKVVTYGDVADKVGLISRTVGWIMASFTEEEFKNYPWHRVVGGGGTIPALKYGFRGNVQIELLTQEGLTFTDSLKIVDFDRYRFKLS